MNNVIFRITDKFRGFVHNDDTCIYIRNDSRHFVWFRDGLQYVIHAFRRTIIWESMEWRQ